jgi:hypothetical protein
VAADGGWLFLPSGEKIIPNLLRLRTILILLMIVALSTINSDGYANRLMFSAGKAPADNHVTPGPVLQTDTPYCVIPFTRAGNLIVIQATVDTISGNFILDTGAPYLILNHTYFRDFQVNYGGEEQTSITGTGAAVSKTSVKKFTLGNLQYNRIDADLINLGHIENSKGIKILGLLGMELFRQCELIIDYEKNLLYLCYLNKKTIGSYKNEQLADASSYSTIPIDVMDSRIFASTTIAGKKLRLIIDSGAESNLLDSRLPNKVFDNITITGRVLLSGSGSRKIEALSGDFKYMKVGNLDVGTLPVLITNLEKTCFSYSGCVDGILGFDFLSMHKIGFNFVANKMYIWK